MGPAKKEKKKFGFFGAKVDKEEESSLGGLTKEERKKLKLGKGEFEVREGGFLTRAAAGGAAGGGGLSGTKNGDDLDDVLCKSISVSCLRC